MYFRVNERVGDYGDETSLRGPTLGLPVALPVGGGVVAAAIVAAVEALALVATAMAAAYLLIQAYEKAKSLGIGVEWAKQQLVVAMSEVVRTVKNLIRELERSLAEARRRRLPPECEQFVERLKVKLAKMIEAVGRYESTKGDSVRWMELYRAVEESKANMPQLLYLVGQCLAGTVFRG